MNNTQAKIWILPWVFVGALAVSACSSDPMIMDAPMAQGDQGMETEMMDEMQEGDAMEQGMENSMDSQM